MTEQWIIDYLHEVKENFMFVKEDRLEIPRNNKKTIHISSLSPLKAICGKKVELEKSWSSGKGILDRHLEHKLCIECLVLDMFQRYGFF